MTEEKKKENGAKVAAVCGLIGSSVGKICLHPIDTLKAKLQVTQMQKTLGETAALQRG